MSTWNGKIKFGMVEVPIALQRAVKDESTTFSLYHTKSKERIHRIQVTEKIQTPITNDEISKGFQSDDGTVVLFTEDEVKELRGSLEHYVEVIDFVPTSEVTAYASGTRYYILPTGTGKHKFKGYQLLVKAMQEEGLCAVCRFVLRTKQYTGIVQIQDWYLTLTIIPYSDEVVDTKTLNALTDLAVQPPSVTDKELKMARTLLKSMKVKFNPENYKDEFKEKLIEEVERKKGSRKEKSNVIPIRKRRTG